MVKKHFTAAFTFEELKKGPDGLIPVIVQDFANGEVLMLAYMNKEAYEQTLREGIMCYWSRSRQELWRKGDTSGHYLPLFYIPCLTNNWNTLLVPHRSSHHL